jgi:hypothetical protein
MSALTHFSAGDVRCRALPVPTVVGSWSPAGSLLRSRGMRCTADPPVTHRSLNHESDHLPLPPFFSSRLSRIAPPWPCPLPLRLAPPCRTPLVPCSNGEASSCAGISAQDAAIPATIGLMSPSHRSRCRCACRRSSMPSSTVSSSSSHLGLTSTTPPGQIVSHHCRHRYATAGRAAVTAMAAVTTLPRVPRRVAGPTRPPWRRPGLARPRAIRPCWLSCGTGRRAPWAVS